MKTYFQKYIVYILRYKRNKVREIQTGTNRLQMIVLFSFLQKQKTSLHR